MPKGLRVLTHEQSRAAIKGVTEAEVESWREAIRRERKAITGHGWGHAYAVSYGRPGWPSQSYRLFVWDAD